MSADISARIGIDGEKSFRDSLAAINSQMKNLGSEMKAVVSSFAGMEDSEEAVTAKTDVLQRSVSASADKLKLLQGQSERAKDKLNSLAKELETATQEFEENSQQAIKAQNAYNRQVVAVNRLETQINQTTAELNRMERELRDAGKAAEDMGDDLQDAAKDADVAGTSFRDAFLGGAISGAIQSMADGISALVEDTAEYRKIMGTLEASSEKAGYSAEQTAVSYQQLYGVIGDNQQTATALANLQALELEQDKLKQLTEGAIGAWATYGDSIPIDGLAEAINETIKAGIVTGSFADVLNWAGTSEDDFNEKLEAAGSQAKRANLVLQEMAKQGLMQTAEAWRQNNAEIVAANEASADLEATMGSFGEMLSPVVTTAKQGMNEFLQIILSVAEAFQSGGLQGAFAEIGVFTSQFMQQIQAAIPAAAETMKGLFTAMQTYLSENLSGMIQTGMEFLVGFSEGIRTKAGILVEAGLSLVGTLANGIIQSLPTLIQTIPQIVINIAGIINDNAPKVLTAGLTLMKNLVIGVLQSIPTVVQSIPQIIEAVVSVFLAFNWMNLGKNIITSLKDGMIAMVQTVRGAAQNLLSNIEAVLSAMPGKMLNLGKQGMQGLINGIRSLFGVLGSAARTATTAVTNVFKELPGKLLQVGKDTITGFVNGIKSAIVNATTAVSTAVASIKDVFTNTDGFDTHSPSKWSEKIAGWVMQGLGFGFANDKSAVTAAKAATGEIKEVFDEAAGEIGDTMLSAAENTEAILPYIRKTAKKVSSVLETEMEQTNRKIESLQKKAAEEQTAYELKQHKETLAKKQKELTEAEKENKQKILEEIAKIENDWNKKQTDAARNAEEKALQERVAALQEFQRKYESVISSIEKEYESAVSSIQSKQDSLQGKLSSYGSLFEWVKTEEDKELFQLGDLDAEIRKIQKYSEAIDAVRGKGLSDGLMGEISQMDVDDALAYMDKLIAMSDTKLEQYIQKYEEKQKLAAQAAEKFYQSDMEALEKAYAEKLPDVIGGASAEIQQLGAGMAESLKQGLEADGSNLGQAVTEAISSAVLSTTEATQEQNMLQIIGGMQQQEPLLTEYIETLKEQLIALIESFWGNFRNVGEDMMDGVAQGIRDGRSGVVNAVAAVIAAAIARAKSDLDINSPSRVFAEMGEYSMEGYALGMQNRLKNTIQTMRNSMAMVTSVPVPAVGTSGGQTYSNTYGDINLYIDTVNNGNGRDTQMIARELEFFRRQQNTGRGGT